MKKLFIFGLSYFLGLLFCLIAGGAFAQTDKFAIPQAPTGTADAMTIFGQYPQSSYTGVPAINIPIYNFTYEGLSLPIALSYNNNLVKPYNPGSWVGLGWDLTAGGVINRVVNGKPDDCNWYNRADYDRTGDTLMGYYYNHGYLAVSNWYDSVRIHHAFTDLYNILGYTTSGDVTSCTVRDYAPDEFDFSIGDLSGSFYLDDQGNWKVKSENPVKVFASFAEVAETSPVANHTYLKSITLIDNRGIKYEFGNALTNNGFEMIKSDAADSTDIFIKSWYINRITFPNDKKIEFSYISSTVVDYEQPSSVSGSSVIYARQTNNPVYLSSIETDQCSISFVTSERSTHHRELDTIKIGLPYDDTQLKKFAFTYSATTNNSFRLTDFSQLDKNNSPGVHYGFQYNSLNFGLYPPNIDYWGYYKSGTITSGMSRDTAHCRAELLDRITYPTGGYTEYTWEPNQAKWYTDSTNTVQSIDYNYAYYPGGARIKQVTNYDNVNAQVSSKRYVYEKGYRHNSYYSPVSSGVLHAVPIGVNSYSLLTYQLDGESHVTYSEVTELNDDESYTTTTFTNSDNGYGNEAYQAYMQVSVFDSSHHLTFPTYTSNAYKRGFPLTVKNYSNKDTLLSKKAIQYTEGNHQYVRALSLSGEGGNYNKTAVSFPSQPDGWYGSALKIYTSNFLPSVITDTIYNHTAHPLTKLTTYGYDSTTVNLKYATVTNSKGETEETDYLYPRDMVSNSLDPHGVYAGMDSANYISPVIETIKKVNGTQVSLSKTEYKRFVYYFHTMFKPDSSTVKYGSGPTKTTSKYVTYDNFGHLVTELQNGVLPVTYIYDYKGRNIVAKIVNATREEVAYQDFETPPVLDDPYLIHGAGHSGSHYYNTAYLLPFGYPNGRNYVLSNWYHISGNAWKYGRKPVLPGSYPLTYPHGANAMDDILIYPADAIATTFSYNLVAGLTNVTDNNGHTTNYEYDDFQRLVNIRDEDGNIKTHYCYNYAGQETDCTVPYVPALSPPPDPPPPPYSPDGVYARLEIGDMNSEFYGSGDETSIFQTGTVCIKIYSDAACTTPITLDHNLTLGLVMKTRQIDDGSTTSTDTELDSYTIPTGESSICIGPVDLDDFTHYVDEDGDHYEEFVYDYSLQTPGSHYAVVPPIYY